MRRTTIALLLCGCLLFTGCGASQLYIQGVPANAPAQQSQGISGSDVLTIIGIAASVTLIVVTVN